MHGWERLGRGICHAARKFLKLVTFEYVDDYFGPDWPEAVEHGMQCFARLVRVFQDLLL